MSVSAKPFILVLIVLGMLLAGCATTNVTGGPDTYIPLNQALKHNIKSTSVYLGRDPANDNNVVTQGMAAPQQVGGGSAGVIGAFIGSLLGGMIVSENENERQQKQHARLAIQQALIKYNYASKFRAQLQQQLSDQKWLNVEDVQKEPRFLSGDYSSLAAQVDTDTVLIFDTYYKMAPDLKTFSMVANVVLYPTSKRLKASTKHKSDDVPVLFHNRYTVEFTENDSKHVVGFWTQDGRLNKVLDVCIPALIQTAIADLNDKTSRTLVDPPSLDGMKGHLKIKKLDSGEYKLIGDVAAL